MFFNTLQLCEQTNQFVTLSHPGPEIVT